MVYKLIYNVPWATNLLGVHVRNSENSQGAQVLNSLGVFNKTIIPLALVGYWIVITTSALRDSLAIYHVISNGRTWNSR